ncbi:MAG: sensor histidine kinase, partial [Clostridiales bacterium]|nr:sensor histidine kinase [Clostridiales bacterium]
ESHIADDLFVNGNKGQLEQLTTILLDNAVSHTSSDESRKTVSVVLKKVRDHVILEVTNPGKEIPEAERQVLFTRFYRADDSREYTGHYGLGLSIAKAICDAHDGKIEVTCEDGLVTFRVFLKAA